MGATTMTVECGLWEAHNFSNGLHTLGQDEALHGFVHLVTG